MLFFGERYRSIPVVDFVFLVGVVRGSVPALAGGLLWLLLVLGKSASGYADAGVEASSFRHANAPGAIGEIEHLYLPPSGAYAHGHYNDFVGETDKLLSGGFKLGLLRQWRHSGVEVKAAWRYVTPAFKPKYGATDLPKPVGAYADWGVVQGAYAHILEPFGDSDWKLRLQGNLGLDHVGNKGAREIHTSFHKLIGSPTSGLEYTNQEIGYSNNYGIETAIITPITRFSVLALENMVTTGYSYNKFMRETYVSGNQVYTFSEDYKLGLEIKVAHQIGSDGFDRPKDTRYEVATGALLFGFYKPAIKYISPYLKGDNFRQIVVDPIVFHLRF